MFTGALCLVFYCNSPAPARSFQEHIVLAIRNHLPQRGSGDQCGLLFVQVRVLGGWVCFLKCRLIEGGAGFSVGDFEVTVLQGFTWFDALGKLVVYEFQVSLHDFG